MTRPGLNRVQIIPDGVSVGDEESESRSGETPLKSRGEEAIILRPIFTKTSTTAKDWQQPTDLSGAPASTLPTCSPHNPSYST